MKKFILLLLLLIPVSLFSQNIDINLLKSIHNPQPLPTDPFFRTVSNSDIYVVIGIPTTMTIAGYITKNKQLTANGYEGLETVASNIIFTAIIKFAVNRERPFKKYPQYITNKTYMVIKDASFPSGHTSSAFALATSLSLEYPKWYVIAPSFVFAGTVGYSRMELGAHYPSDVLAGALVGTGSAYLNHFINKKLNHK
jgi:membrane-associated phospholipid phosphatase